MEANQGKTKLAKTHSYRTIERTKGIPCRLLAESDRAYLAGFIEGDGSIGITKRKTNNYKNHYSLAPYIIIANTDYSLMCHIKNIIQVGTLKTHKYDARYRRLPLYLIDVAAKGEVLWLLEQIVPYLTSFKLGKSKLLHQFLLSRVSRKTGILQRDSLGRIKVVRFNHLTQDELTIYDKLMELQPITKGLYKRNLQRAN